MLLIKPKIRFIRCLGTGGFGSVYLGEIESDDGIYQHIAIKLLNEKMSANDDIAARQRDEARLLGMLNHDNIVKVFDLGTINGKTAVFMEYIEGVDLKALTTERKLPSKIAILIGASVAGALHAAQNTINPKTALPLSVIHRDIKPANILLSVSGITKVLDFGIAKGNFDREGHTQSVQFGTAHFMAPEQLLFGEQNPSVDIFALGLTLWNLITGKRHPRLPLQKASFESKVSELIAQIPTELKKVGVDNILHRMMAFHPIDRCSPQMVELELLHISDQMQGPSMGQFAHTAVSEILKNNISDTQAVPSPTQSSNISIDTPSGIRPLPTSRQLHLKKPLLLFGGLLLSFAFLYWGPIFLKTFESNKAHSEQSNIEPLTQEAPAILKFTEPYTTEPITKSTKTKEQSKQTTVANPTQFVDKPSIETTKSMPISVTILSLPSGKQISLDDQIIGTTPIQGIPIAQGSHQLSLTDPLTHFKAEKSIHISTDNPTRFKWVLKEEQWHCQPLP